LKTIDPSASAAAALGAAIRSRRVSGGLRLADLSRMTGYAIQHISGAELAQTAVSEPFIAALDEALEAAGEFRRLYPAVLAERTEERQRRATERRSAATVDDAKRRAFISLGLAVVLFGPDAAARALDEAKAEQIVHAWSRELFLAPDRQALLPGIALDLKRLSASGSHRAIARLSSFVASIAVCGGDTALAERWWRRAQHAANTSGDRHLAAFVTGQRAVHALYGGSVAQSLTLADHGLRITTMPCAGRMQAGAAKAQALALLSRKQEARDALRELEATFERLPRDITRDKVTSLGWPEERLHHTISYVSAFGGLGGGEPARESAMKLYPPVAWRGPAQIKLHRAASEVDAQRAVATLSALSEAQRHDRGIHLIARRVIEACEARGAKTADLRAVLS